MPEANTYYYKNKAGEAHGPYRFEDIEKLILKRDIVKRTPLSTDGQQWGHAAGTAGLNRRLFKQARRLHRQQRRISQFLPSCCFFLVGFFSLYIVLDVVITLHWLADVAIVLSAAVLGGLLGIADEGFIKNKYGQPFFETFVRRGIILQAAFLWFIFPFFMGALFMLQLWLTLLVWVAFMVLGAWRASRRMLVQ